MSALIGICSAETIHLLTDGASVWAHDGSLAEFQVKQVHGTAMTIAATGCMRPCIRFSNLIEHLSFDGAVAAAPAVWSEVVTQFPPAVIGASYAALLGGWSEARQALELYALGSDESADMTDLTAYAIGPTDEALASTRRFVDRFADNPEAFDAHRDGVALMEELRRYPRRFLQAVRPCVGGFVQHTAVSRYAVRSELIHQWPGDRLGHPIGDAAA